MIGSSVLSTFGWILGFVAAAQGIAAIVATRYLEQAAQVVFAGSSLVCSFVALGLIFGFRGREVQLRRRHGLGLVVLVWVGVPVFAAMPFAALLVEESPFLAYFEAVSAFTTTGSTLISSIDSQPRSIVFWRALLGWAGGAATIVFAVASLDRTRWDSGQGLLIFSAGLADQSRLRLAAKDFLPFYIVMTAVCFFALLSTGLPRFDAMCLALSALSTSGVLPRDGVFADYGSLGAAYVMSIFMLSGAALYFLAKVVLSGGSRVVKISVFVFAGLAAVVLTTALLIWGLMGLGNHTIGAGAAGALFSIVSLISTTGFVFDEMTAAAIPLPAVLILVLVGGIYGSTSGGLKIGRVVRMLSDARRELERLIHPAAMIRAVSTSGQDDAGRIVWTYFFAYMIVFAILASVTGLHGVDFEHALLWAAATVSNVGPAIAYLPPAEMDPLAIIASEGGGVLLAASAATMILGRIEVLAVLAILTTTFWRR